MRLLFGNPLAVHLDLDTRIKPRARLLDDKAVHRHHAALDQRRRAPSRGHPRVR